MKTLFFIGEIGLNHCGDINIAKKIINIAVNCGCSAVKFQKRTPDLCVPESQKNIMKETPWGNMTYLEYRKKIEFGESEYDEIDKYCKEKNIDWFCSSWDIESQKFLRKYNLKYNKVASAMLTNLDLLNEIAAEGKRTFISTGMSDWEEINKAVEIFRNYKCPFTIMHCTSTYPCAFYEVNLRMIDIFRTRFPESVGIGFSDHTKGLVAGPLAINMGATILEKHITNDRGAFGSDQSNSLEEKGLKAYIRDCNNVEKMIGDGVKIVYESEISIKNKLRNK